MITIIKKLNIKSFKIRFIITIIMLWCSSITNLGFISANNNTFDNCISYKKSQTVYYCTGPKAKRFHKSPYCKGLNKCSGRIVKCSKEEAKKKGFSPCRICYKR